MAAPERRTIHSRASLGGHPLHATMVHFPVAALLGVIASDAGYLYTGDPFWARVSLWLAGVGAFGGWLASLVGAVDLFTVREIRRMITSWSHAVLAVTMLSLASLNWIHRLDATEAIYPWGLYLSLLTGGLIVVTGYFGGQLVYEHAVGVNVDE